MYRIAILTLYYKNYNYGGLLQAYALQKTIEELGFYAVQISYDLKSGYENWSPFKEWVRSILRAPYYYLSKGSWAKDYYIRRNKMKEFASTIPHTRTVTSKSIASLQDDYDLFICGSDQVWNPIGWQPTLFLDFLDKNKRRISYAASVSRDVLTQEEINYIGKYLAKYSSISVREKSTAEMLNSCLHNLNIFHAPDPVFLLDENHWNRIMKEYSNSSIFAYFLGDNTKNKDRVIEYAKEINKDVRFVSHMDTGSYIWEKNREKYLEQVLGIGEFLYGIKNAELVLTDSFHAVAFACIMGTPFFVMPRFEDGDKDSMNSRLRDLTSELGVSDRFTKTPRKEYEWKDGELKRVKDKLSCSRELGRAYLLESISQTD